MKSLHNLHNLILQYNRSFSSNPEKANALKNVISIHLILIFLSGVILFNSCSKKLEQSAQSSSTEISPNTRSQDSFPIAGKWQAYSPSTMADPGQNYCAQCNADFKINLDYLDSTMLQKGKVLVYVKFENISSSIHLLPSNNINVYVTNYLIDISATNDILSTAQFRYILIPPAALSGTDKLDFYNYDAVIAYYHLSE